MKHLTPYELHIDTHCATHETLCIICNNLIRCYISTNNNTMAHFFKNTVSPMTHNELKRDSNTKRLNSHNTFIINMLIYILHTWHFMCYISNINFYTIKFLKTIKGIAK